ncbi:OmpW/AlkL family protein [Aquabacterium sp. OR-4]|uniref:OmpW/AlkL family protein n=1 Tax=Aquabacterium sp. OR-4 TaxID=2978127 RepID=UPI0021B1E893|nr:OmpW family outer membrane protein [Aquabacterium sp. OR-4]MDT7837403.1 OmpW family outer membrane protein [Aquabacterium sp. OR-4]
MTAIRSLIAIAAAAAAVSALPVQAQDTGNFIVRARAVYLDSANKDSTDLDAKLQINNKTIPELDISYFFTPNLAAELILTYPQKQKLTALDEDGARAQIGTFKHLPPTLTVQYHFTGLGGFRPYLGAGVNYTNISAVKILNGAVGLKHNSWGLAAQVGADVPLGGGWLLNVDVKKVQIGTTVYVGGVDHGKFKVDPLLVGVGVGKRF